VTSIEEVKICEVKMKYIIEKENINSKDANELIEELSDELYRMTGSNGRGSFDNSDIDNPRAIFVIAREDNGMAVGCGAFREVTGEIAELKRMYVRRKSHGIGSKILAHLEDCAIEYGYNRVVLETRKCNTKAVNFYTKNGYQVINNYGKYIDRPEAICFEKIL
jgi:GNAT superfamily N-acetyltransferase